MDRHRGKLWKPRESKATGAWRQSPERIQNRDQRWPALHSLRRLSACLPRHWGLSAEAQPSEVRPRERTWVDCHKDSLRSLVLHSWGSPGKSLDLPERQEILFAGPTNSVRSQTAGRHLHECRHRWEELQLQSTTPEVLMLATASACLSARGGAGCGSSLWTQKWVQWLLEPLAKLWAGTSHWPHLPGSLCNLALSSDPQPGANSPRRAQDHLRWQQFPTGLCHCRNSLHIGIVSAISFPLPNLTKQGSHTQALLETPLVWVKNRLCRAAYKRTWGQNQNWAPKAVSPKKRKQIWVVD